MWVCCRRASERCSRAGERRDLEDDGAVGQGGLRREEDAAARAAAQLGQQPEVADALADGRELRAVAVRLEQAAVAVEHDPQRAGPLREAAEDVLLGRARRRRPRGGSTPRRSARPRPRGGARARAGGRGTPRPRGRSPSRASAPPHLARQLDAELLGGAARRTVGRRWRRCRTDSGGCRRVVSCPASRVHEWRGLRRR